MATATQEKPQIPTTPKPASGEQLPALHGPRLPFHPLIEQRFGIDRASWKALCEAIFPTATTVESIVLALSYCKARKLDPFKRNVHIVPIWNKQLGCMIDTIWPGIGELRTTAFRTGEYAGRGDTVYGPDLTQKVGSAEVTFPEWAQVTVFRIVKGQRVEFAGPRIYWLETYATVKRTDDTPNEMWLTRPRGQIDKCAEAAALRAGFPEEIGSDYIAEEVQHSKSQILNGDAKPVASIEDLTARLETEQAPSLAAGEITPEQAAAMDAEEARQAGFAIDQCRAEFAAAETKEQVLTVHQKWSNLTPNNEAQTQVDKLAEEAHARVAPKAGKSKQTELVK